ncbi:hypothetical protein V8G54_007321 [Vigna mungo]|uniref:Integrase zinc-binding domain-containing protein n=1 Tax=Vigna mungo TaxID=3915 RepID=A0AAQ3S8Z0_VIGMU
MESCMDTVKKMMQELVQDRNCQENEYHGRFRCLEDMIRGLTVVVEQIILLKMEEIRHSIFTDDEAYGWTNRLERYFRLKDGASIPNLRPYKYSHNQKNEYVEGWLGMEDSKGCEDECVPEGLLVDPTAHSLYELQKGRLYYHDKLVLPKHYSRIPTIIQELHESPLGGHSGYFCTLKRIAGVLYWEGMRKDIKAFVMQCETWQRNKSEMLAPTGLLQPLPVPTQVWSDIYMDFIGVSLKLKRRIPSL